MARGRFYRPGLVLAALIGIPLGIGSFTLHYAGATSYLSSDPKACANCHIMNNQYDSWQKASHHTSATCVDCHLPAEGVEKWIAKAANGYHHSRAFTMQDFHEPIQIGERNAEILQENCVRCHDGLLHSTMHEGVHAQEPLRCTHCHRSVGHGPTLGLGGPEHPAEHTR